MALAAFPAEGIATFLTPNSLHIEMAQDSPRALKLPVGFTPSSFTHNCSHPNDAANRGVLTNGDHPSPKDTMLAGFFTGSTGAYRHMLRGPSAIHSRFQLSRAFGRSYRTRSGQPSALRLCSFPAS